MNQDDREKKLRAVQNAKDSFTVAPAPAGKCKLAKRLGRKLTFWYVQPFGGKQNIFNEEAADMLEALNESVNVLESHFSTLAANTEHRLTELRKSQRAVIARNYAEHQEQLQNLADRIDRSLTIAAPESRSDAGLEPLTTVPVIGTEALFQEFRNVQNAASDEGAEKALAKLGADYRNLLAESVRTLTAPEQCKPIALVCAKFGSAAGMKRSAMRSGISTVCCSAAAAIRSALSPLSRMRPRLHAAAMCIMCRKISSRNGCANTIRRC